MANLKKFLIPVSVAIAGLAAGNSRATVDAKASALALKSDQPAAKLSARPHNNARRVIFAQGNELHSLILARNEQGVILSDHESHASHASHASHSSHYSGR